MAARFEVSATKGGQFRWRLVAANGRVLTQSESFATKAVATRSLASARRAAAEAPPAPAGAQARQGLEIRPHHGKVWRVGYAPDPWAWSDWTYASDEHRFDGRWDDCDGRFRTIYAGSSLLACLLEVLAPLRPDQVLVEELDEIEDNDTEEDALHPTATAGSVSHTWLEPRMAGSAILDGAFCAVTATASVAALRPEFVGTARALGLYDFDAAALKDGRPRALTQAVATHLHETTTIDGLTFASRHGDDLRLWAIFERPEDGRSVSPALRDTTAKAMTPEEPGLVEAFELLGLMWSG